MKLKIKKYGLYFLFAINLLVIISFWSIGSAEMFGIDSSGIYLALGRLAGLLAVYFVLLQFVFMGRAVWIEKIFGLDKLSSIHRLNGYLSILLIILHPIFITVSYGISNKLNFIDQFIDFLKNYPDLFSASLAVILFISIVFLSIYIVRKHLKYETWYFIHLLTYLAVILAFGHQLKLGGDFSSNLFTTYWYLLYLFVFGNLLFFRFFKPFYNFYKYNFKVKNLVNETESTTSIYIEGKNLQSFKSEAGQFIIVRFLAKGLWWQAHPFSLSYIQKNNQLRITVRNLGDFTSKIPSLKIGTKIFIEGPYGGFTAENNPHTKFLFIAGGVGITPIRALIEKTSENKSNIVVLYSSKNSTDIIFKSELDQLSQKNNFPIFYIMSDELEYAGEKGRIDKDKLERLVKNIQEREVYVCGPKPMIESMKKILQENFNLKSPQIHYEKFSL